MARRGRIERLAHRVLIERLHVVPPSSAVRPYAMPGAARLVELAWAWTLRRRRALVHDTVDALAAGTRSVVSKPAATVGQIARASGADAALVRAQLRSVLAALRPPLRLDRGQLARWARFDARFGILARPPDLSRAFPR